VSPEETLFFKMSELQLLQGGKLKQIESSESYSRFKWQEEA
jgi:hypothetical protein